MAGSSGSGLPAMILILDPRTQKTTDLIYSNFGTVQSVE
jgi:hypothetical protein